MVDNKIIGSRLEQLRKEKNETQTDVANVLNVQRQIVSYYETGRRTPNVEDLMILAGHYNTTVDYLLGRTDTKTIDEDIQMICDYTGLNEKAIKRLHKHIKFAPSDADILSFLIAPNSISRYFNDLVNITSKLRYYQETYLEIVSKLSSIENQINNLSQKEIEDILDDIEIEMKDAKIFYYDVFEEFRLLIDDFNKLYIKTPDNEALVMDCILEMNNVLEEYYNGEHS